jgi:O-antigen/teichoic acid export membrane protein
MSRVRSAFSWSEQDQATLLARNVLTDYIAIGVDMVLGLVMLPFNVAHLGPAAYGLWVLSTSVTTYFSMLDLGYGSAQVKFAAQYRALRDADALNEITSTLFFLFSGLAVAMYVIASTVAFRLGDLFALGPAQAATGRWVLMIVSAHIALGLPFSVFGGVTNGFQRFYLNNIISIITSITVALATVLVLLRGHGLLELVAVTTSIRIAALFAYRTTAYRAFPLLSVRWRHVRKARLQEVTAFSIFLLVIDVAQKINYSADTMVIGAFMGTAAIAIWAVGARLILAVRTLSQVLGRLLFPAIVDGATRGSAGRLQRVLTQGTRLSLAMVTPMALVLALLADRIVAGWVGPRFAGSVAVIQLLAVVVTLRIGTNTAYTLLKGGGHHRFAAAATMTVALSNLALSLVLVRPFGLMGVAFGTLIPVALSSLFFVVPKACRRAELPLGSFVRWAVWPALWPAIPAAAAVLAVRALVPGLPSVILGAAAGGLGYAVAFLGVAVGDEDRRWYVARALDTFRGPRAPRPRATAVAS